MQHFKIMSLV